MKELKKKQPFRLVGGVEMGSWGGKDLQQGSGWRTKWVRWWLADLWSHICMWINGEE